MQGYVYNISYKFIAGKSTDFNRGTKADATTEDIWALNLGQTTA